MFIDMAVLKPCFYLFVYILFHTLCCSSSFAQTDAVEYVELQTRTSKNISSYYLNDDFTVATTMEYELQLLSDNAVDDNKRMRFSYSTSIEKFEVVQAYTLKPDGKKIPVPNNNYQLNVNKGHKGSGPIFLTGRR